MEPPSMRWPRYVSFVPSALLVIGIVWNIYFPSDFWGDYVLGAAVMVAGALLSLRHTIAVGAVLVLVDLALLIKVGDFGHLAGTFELTSAVFTALVGIGVNRVVARHGRHLEAVRSVAEAAQRAVLP